MRRHSAAYITDRFFFPRPSPSALPFRRLIHRRRLRRYYRYRVVRVEYYNSTAPVFSKSYRHLRVYYYRAMRYRKHNIMPRTLRAKPSGAIHHWLQHKYTRQCRNKRRDDDVPTESYTSKCNNIQHQQLSRLRTYIIMLYFRAIRITPPKLVQKSLKINVRYYTYIPVYAICIMGI